MFGFYSALPEVFIPIETILVLNQLKSQTKFFLSPAILNADQILVISELGEGVIIYN